MTLPLRALLRLTFHEPRAAAAQLTLHTPPRPVLIEAAVLVSALSVILAWVVEAVAPGAQPEGEALMGLSPLLLAVIQFFSIMLTALLIHGIGQAFGGRGSLDQALAVTVWLQAVMLVVQLAAGLIGLVAPPIGAALTLGSYFWFFYLMVQFVTVLHAFRSAWMVAGGVLLAGLVLSFVILFILGLARGSGI